jgi:uncharacterized protein
MKSIQLTGKEWGERICLALFFIAMGFLIYIVFSPLRPMIDKLAETRGIIFRSVDYLGRIGLIAILLLMTLLFRKSDRLNKYSQIPLGLLIMAVAVSLDWITALFLMDHLGLDGNTPVGFALLKLNECAIVVSVVVSITLMSGGSLGSIYIQKGNLKLGLTIGLITFTLAAAGSSIMATLLFKPQDLTLARIISWLPWLLIFVLANATQEELLFRGLFLRKLQQFFGKFFSNLIIMLIFTLLHGSVTYTSDVYLFLAIVVPLALAWGTIMQKTDSIWGSILFHAGMDIPIMLGIFSNLK